MHPSASRVSGQVARPILMQVDEIPWLAARSRHLLRQVQRRGDLDPVTDCPAIGDGVPPIRQVLRQQAGDGNRSATHVWSTYPGISQPPSTCRIWPVVYPAPDDAR